jgi:uncharacterized membrane protein SirB2
VTEFYPEIRFVHIAAVFASGGLFLLRGIVLFTGGRWATAAPVRYLSYTIDTVLLVAAVMLTIIVEQYPFVHDWLTVKVLLLVVYIVLGFIAFWKGRTLAARVGCWIAALVVYAYIITVARAHNPLGIFAAVFG